LEADVGGAGAFLGLGCDGSVFFQTTPDCCRVDCEVVVGGEVPGDGVCSSIVLAKFAAPLYSTLPALSEFVDASTPRSAANRFLTDAQETGSVDQHVRHGNLCGAGGAVF